jgi:glycosyltransferase involved in cell wall biosynthesis
MKVLIDGRLLSNKPTGISRYTLELIKVYNKRYGSENVCIIIPYRYTPLFSNKTIRSKLSPYNLFHFILFPFFISTKGFNLYHSPFYSGFYIKLSKAKFICTIHDLMYAKVQGFFSNVNFINNIAIWYYNIIIRLSIKNSDILVSVSKTTQSDLKDHFGLDSILISEGVNKTLSFSNNKNDFKLSNYNLEEFKYFLYVGNDRPHKNLDFLIRVFSKYQGECKLVLVGHNPSKNHKFNSSIQYFDNLSDGDLACLFKFAKAFIYPSLYEGFGLPVLEAIQNSCYVISSNAGALKEFKLNSIVFFNPKIEDELLTLLNNANNFNFDKKDLEILNDYDWGVNFNLLVDILIEKEIVK